MGQPISIKRKIFLLGDEAVGKTSLIRRFVVNEFSDAYISTIGTKVTKKVIDLDHPRGGPRPLAITLMIWDVMGQRSFETVVAKYFEGAEGALIVFDLTRPETLESTRHWIKLLFRHAGRVPLLFMANKADLKKSIRVARDAVEALASEYQTKFYITSAKTGLNVDTAFEELATTSILDALE